ncbi:hypothetical protein GUJ93_ZPchr0007g5699 [Zizania palustris]|uniref:Phytocyanin domain-containing protein n=1 Tax=Zizania palustris TaxID=103762 RepID=A0A8J5SU99_ZIZPA|nr:hypothetical protein GUJ93_ZPchr0007g5699 [Zizania palustris]
MKSNSGALLAVVMAVAAVASTAVVAKDYTVGCSYGWTTYVDYGQVDGRQGRSCVQVRAVPQRAGGAGGRLRQLHGEQRVSVRSGGNTTFELAAAGTRYFICSIPRHCLNGTMRVKVPPSPTPPPQPPQPQHAAADAALRRRRFPRPGR